MLGPAELLLQYLEKVAKGRVLDIRSRDDRQVVGVTEHFRHELPKQSLLNIWPDKLLRHEAEIMSRCNQQRARIQGNTGARTYALQHAQNLLRVVGAVGAHEFVF